MKVSIIPLVVSLLFIFSCSDGALLKSKINSSKIDQQISNTIDGSKIVNNKVDQIMKQDLLKMSALYNGVSAIRLSDKKSSSSGGDLTIQTGETVVIDTDLDVNTLSINGSLACSNQFTTNFKIKANTIYVNGTFECGASENNRFTGQLSILLKDSSITTAARRGFIVNRGGQLRLFGALNKSNWTRLSETASVGQTVLKLETAVAQGWQSGDKIVIGPTGYNPNEAEALDVVRVFDNGKSVQIAQPLKYNHWGTIQTFQGKTGPVNLDQRAEVANLSRNIKISADESVSTISDQYGIGGHLMAMPGGRLYIDAAEFSRMGQAGVLGRYPIHWHMVGDAYGQFVRNSSVHRSFQRCITVHSTQRALLQNNVCYDFRGHGFFLEDGDEIDNIIVGNLAMFGRRQFPDKVLIDSDRANSFDENRASAMSGIWIAHPRNIVRDNVVSGTEGTGIWMSFITGDIPNTNGRIINKEPIVIEGQQIIARPTKSDTTDFSNNVAHTNVVGINWDAAPGKTSANNPRNPHDKLLDSAYYTPSVTPTYSNLTVYKNRITGIYYRGNTAIFDRSILADNGWAFFVAYNQVLSNSTIIARSNNHDANDEKYMYVDGYSWGRKPTGMVLYDGPAELDNVSFLRFSPEKTIKTIHGTQHDVTPTLFYEIGGHNKYMSLFKNLYIEGKPYYKFNRGFRTEDEKSNFTKGWHDARNSTQARDLDGSLTGRPGSIVVPDDPFIKHPSCVNEVGYDGYVVCDGQKRVTSLYMAVNNSYRGGGGVPFLVYRNDGPSTIPVNDSQVNIDTTFDLLMAPAARGMNNKFSMLSGYEYTVVFRRDDVVNDFRKLDPLIHIQVSSETLGEMSPVIRMAGLGAQCRLVATGAPITVLNSVDQLRGFNGSGYYSSEGDFYFKLKTNTNFDMATGATMSKQSISKEYWISCDKPPQPKVIGMYDLSVKDGKVFASGWACDQTVNQSIDLHFYVANGSNPQEMIGATTANISSENQVLAACANYKGAYRFRYEFSDEQVKKHAGKTFIAYGLSKSGGVNNALSNTGSSVLPSKDGSTGLPRPPVPEPQPVPAPAPAPTPAPQPAPAPAPAPLPGNNGVVGYIDGISSDRVVNGWLCNKGIAKSISFHIYSGDPGKPATTFVGGGLANASSEPGVAVACGVSSGSYRFNYKLPAETIGKAIHIFGISVSGDNLNKPIARSGELIVQGSTSVPAPQPVPAPTPAPVVPAPAPAPPVPAPLPGDNGIVGYIDGISSGRVVNGWLCNKGISKSINFHIYSGPPGKPATTFVGGGLANASSEPGVAAACGVSSGSYRFSFKLPAETAGKAIHIFGISISGDNLNKPIARSGDLIAP